MPGLPLLHLKIPQPRKLYAKVWMGLSVDIFINQKYVLLTVFFTVMMATESKAALL